MQLAVSSTPSGHCLIPWLATLEPRKKPFGRDSCDLASLLFLLVQPSVGFGFNFAPCKGCDCLCGQGRRTITTVCSTATNRFQLAGPPLDHLLQPSWRMPNSVAACLRKALQPLQNVVCPGVQLRSGSDCRCRRVKEKRANSPCA